MWYNSTPMKKFFVILQLILVGSLCWPNIRPAQAATSSFNMNFVVADDLFTDFASMTADGIQEFLNGQPGVLKSYTLNGQKASQIIFAAAQTNRINPKVILTTIQKESGMVTRTSFNTSGYSGSQQYYLDWITFYGWCDSCSSGTNKGFANQVNATAAAYRRYLDQIADPNYPFTSTGWGPNLQKNLQCIQSDYDGGRQLCTPNTTITIIPANAATAALYTYTPHPGGNYAFWYIWNFTFNFNVRRVYPDGSLLRAQGSPDVWLIQDSQKRRFTTSAAFLSRYSFASVIAVPPEALAVYPTGREISYANYSLLSSPTGGIYLLANDTKRPIASRQAFLDNGFRWTEVVKVAWDVLNQFPDGPTIEADNSYPSGRLMQNKVTGGVYYVKDSIKHPIVSKAIYKSQFGVQKPFPVAPPVLDQYADGLPVGFKDGEIITSKSGGTAYFISHGFRLPIASWQAAIAYKFDRIWGNLLVVDDKSIAIHPLGPTLDVDSSQVAVAGQ